MRKLVLCYMDNSTTVAITDTHAISPREREVLRLIAYEYTTKEIAQQLYLSPYTIDSHRKRMMERLQVKNTAGLIRVGFQCGILTL